MKMNERGSVGSQSVRDSQSSGEIGSAAKGHRSARHSSHRERARERPGLVEEPCAKTKAARVERASERRDDARLRSAADLGGAQDMNNRVRGLTLG